MAIKIIKAPRPNRFILPRLDRKEALAIAEGFEAAGFRVVRARSNTGHPARYTVTATRPPCTPTS